MFERRAERTWWTCSQSIPFQDPSAVSRSLCSLLKSMRAIRPRFASQAGVCPAAFDSPVSGSGFAKKASAPPRGVGGTRWEASSNCCGSAKMPQAPIYRYLRERQGGTVSSNSRFQTVLIQQFSANLSTSPPTGTKYVVEFDLATGVI